MDNQILGERIRQVRDERGYKQEEFAEAIGISRQAFARMEKGKRIISFIELEKLASFLGEHYSIFTDIEEKSDLSLSALCRNENFSQEQQNAFNTIDEILNVFSAQERLYYNMKEG